VGSVFLLTRYHYNIFYICYTKIFAMALFIGIYTTVAIIFYNTPLDICYICVLQVCVNVNILHVYYRTVVARSKILFLGYFAINFLTYQTLLVCTADNLTTFTCLLSWNLGASTSWNSQGMFRHVQGLLYLLILVFVYLRTLSFVKYIFLVFFRPLFPYVLCELCRFIVP
jgi:hypothetical protein